jgi:hypothetical protein
MTDWSCARRRDSARRVSASFGDASSATSPEGSTARRIWPARSLMSGTTDAAWESSGAPSYRATRRAISQAPSTNDATSDSAAGSRCSPFTAAAGRISVRSGRSWYGWRPRPRRRRTPSVVRRSAARTAPGVSWGRSARTRSRPAAEPTWLSSRSRTVSNSNVRKVLAFTLFCRYPENLFPARCRREPSRMYCLGRAKAFLCLNLEGEGHGGDPTPCPRPP